MHRRTSSEDNADVGRCLSRCPGSYRVVGRVAPSLARAPPPDPARAHGESAYVRLCQPVESLASLSLDVTPGAALADVPSCPASRIHDPALTRLIAAWPSVPELIRRAIVAMVESVEER